MIKESFCLECQERTTTYSQQKMWHNIKRMMTIENWINGNLSSGNFESIVKDTPITQRGNCK